jgi:hypothetical protein
LGKKQRNDREPLVTDESCAAWYSQRHSLHHSFVRVAESSLAAVLETHNVAPLSVKGRLKSLASLPTRAR